jgi:hypothetical protein
MAVAGPQLSVTTAACLLASSLGSSSRPSCLVSGHTAVWFKGHCCRCGEWHICHHCHQRSRSVYARRYTRLGPWCGPSDRYDQNAMGLHGLIARCTLRLASLVRSIARWRRLSSQGDARVYLQRDPGLVHRHRNHFAIHRARQADPRRLDREFQQLDAL